MRPPSQPDRSAFAPSKSVIIFFVLLLSTSLLMLWKKEDRWYYMSCPLTSGPLSYAERLEAGLSPDFQVRTPDGTELDLVLWHKSNGDCGDDLTGLLALKQAHGGTLTQKDLEIAKRLYDRNAIDRDDFELALQIVE